LSFKYAKVSVIELILGKLREPKVYT